MIELNVRTDMKETQRLLKRICFIRTQKRNSKDCVTLTPRPNS